MPKRSLGDLLSPILVKEFRQGVRGHVFTGAFLLLHAVLVLATGLSLINLNDPAGSMTVLFWMLLVVPVGLVIPLTGMLSLSSETSLKALEPMLLTRLTPRGIVFGKWASLATQIAILVVSVAPYFLLRYFLGGLQIVYELWGVVVLAVGATVLTAVTVSLSAFRMPAFFRWIAGLGLMQMVGPFVAVSFFASVWMSGGRLAPAVAAGLCLLTVVVMLEAGAWHIAPAADRSSALARGAVLAWLPVAALALDRLPPRLRVQPALWTGLIVMLVVLGSLGEPQSSIPSVYSRYFGRGIRRRVAGWIFAPGWAAGTLFTIVAVVAGCLALREAHPDLAHHEVMLAILAQALLPLPLLPHLTFPRLPATAWYLIVQVASFCVGAMAPIAGEVEAEGIARAFAWFLPLAPVIALGVENETPEMTSEAVDVLSAAVGCLVIAVSLFQSVRGLRRAERLVRERHTALPTSAPAAPADDAPIERVANL